MTTRRAFICTLAGGLLAAPLAAQAQQAGKVYRIGVLSSFYPPGRGAQVAPLLTQALSELGWIEGRNIVIEGRWAEEKYDRLPELAAELVRLKVDVIVTVGNDEATTAARQATPTIPIVMVSGIDPIGAGSIASLTRPGGNVTGMMADVGPEIIAKRLQVLKEAVPKISRVVRLWNPRFSPTWDMRRDVEVAQRELGLTLVDVEIQASNDLENVFAAIRKARADALFVPFPALNPTFVRRIVDFAARNRLPAIYAVSLGWVDAGGLMAYGTNVLDFIRGAAWHVDKILKGAKPADLPVEQPTRLQLAINLKTAKALGLTIPQSLLLRADEIIE